MGSAGRPGEWVTHLLPCVLCLERAGERVVIKLPRRGDVNPDKPDYSYSATTIRGGGGSRN